LKNDKEKYNLNEVIGEEMKHDNDLKVKAEIQKKNFLFEWWFQNVFKITPANKKKRSVWRSFYS
jgi:hypothetical protein